VVATEARAHVPLRIHVDNNVAGIALLGAVVLTHDARLADAANRLKANPAFDGGIVAVRARYVDGVERTRHLVLGTEVWLLDSDPQGAPLWRTAQTVLLTSQEAGEISPSGTDRMLSRFDWVNPRPEVDLVDLEILPVREGTVYVLGAAATLERL
jgi:hypothetical protein